MLLDGMHDVGVARGRSFRNRRLLFIILLILVPLTLSCVTTTMLVEVSHGWKAGDVQQVTISTIQEMDPVWSSEAKKANEQIVAQCKAENVPYTTTMHIPETYAEMMSQFGDEMNLNQDEEGTTLTELPNGIRLSKTMTLSEYQEQTQKSDSVMLTSQKDTVSGVTHYVAEFTIPGFTQGDEPQEYDWAKWDAFIKSDDPPKPKCTLPVAEVGEGTPTPEPQPTSQMGALLFPGGDENGQSSTSPLVDWHMARIWKKMGYPTWFRYMIDLPGEVTVHTMNGQLEGDIDDQGRVVFSFGEAFLRKYTFKGPWQFHVESDVTAKMEKAGTDKGSRAKTTLVQDKKKPASAPAESKEGGEAKPSNLSSSSSPTAKGSASTSGLPRFRIRQASSYAVGLPWGVTYARYELQELDAAGNPGRLARLSFFGAGPAVSVRFMPSWLQREFGARSVGHWTEFEAPTGQPIARLEDFDGIKGYQANSGAFLRSWSGLTFGAPELADGPVLHVDLVGTQVGLCAGADTAKGTWQLKIIGP